MKRTLHYTLCCTLLLWAAACQQRVGQTAKATYINPADMDTTVKACVDFDQYVNGGWKKTTQIPASQVSWGSGNIVRERNLLVLRQILEDASKPGANNALIGNLYASAMDSNLVEQQGLKNLQAELNAIMQIKDQVALSQYFMRLQALGTVNVPYGLFIFEDLKNASQYNLYLSQGGLGLPERDAYFRKDAKSDTTRARYRAYLAQLLTLAGASAADAKAQAEVVYGLESELATAAMTPTEQRDFEKQYNKMTLAQLQQQYANLNLAMELPPLVGKHAEAIVMQPKFFEKLNGLVASRKLEDWKIYLRAHLLNWATPYLSEAYVQAAFDFKQRHLLGRKQIQNRWKRAINWVDGRAGMLLGQAFVAEKFKPEAKAKMMEMIKNIQAAMQDRINQLTWMSEETKQNALKKLAAFRFKIGYPDKWQDYTGLSFTRDNLVGNIMRADEFEFKRNVAKLGKPIDKEEWQMTPHTVDAYYNPTGNEIVFPAGILQPPFFDPNRDDAMNYGGIGAVIGHEFTHGFDDLGRQFDAEGNMKSWWTADDSKKFDERALVMVKQYDQFTVADSIHVNGKLTLGENIADLGGLIIAYHAWLKTKPQQEKIEGYTPAQRFFIAFGNNWRNLSTDQTLINQVRTDPHSPPRYRVMGPLVNMPEFYEAFGCKPSDTMHRAAEQRVSIW